MTKRLNLVRTEFIFETIKMLKLESEFNCIKIITMFEFHLLNNKNGKKTNFFIMRHLFIEHKYPINKNFVSKF